MISWENQKVLLEELSNDPNGDLKRACKIAGISKSTLYRHFKTNPHFKSWVKNAIIDGKDSLRVPELIVILRKQAKKGNVAAIKQLINMSGWFDVDPIQDARKNIRKYGLLPKPVVEEGPEKFLGLSIEEEEFLLSVFLTRKKIRDGVELSDDDL